MDPFLRWEDLGMEGEGTKMEKFGVNMEVGNGKVESPSIIHLRCSRLTSKVSIEQTTTCGSVKPPGPSKRMHWIDLAGNSAITPSLRRSDDDDSMCGNAVMYDIGKILTVGGALYYNLAYGHNRAYVIDLNGPDPVVNRTIFDVLVVTNNR
jgi:hypothetical protein